MHRIQHIIIATSIIFCIITAPIHAAYRFNSSTNPLPSEPKTSGSRLRAPNPYTTPSSTHLTDRPYDTTLQTPYFAPRSPERATREHSPLSETREQERREDGFLDGQAILDKFAPQQQQKPELLMPTSTYAIPAAHETPTSSSTNADRHAGTTVADDGAAFIAFFDQQAHNKANEPKHTTTNASEAEPSDEEQKQTAENRQSPEDHEASAAGPTRDTANHPLVARSRKKRSTINMPEPMQHACAYLGLEKPAVGALLGLATGFAIRSIARGNYANCIPFAGAGIGLYLAQDNKQ